MKKLHYAQYPGNGFGGRCSQYYLIDIFGNRYDIVSEYDKVTEETVYRVSDPTRLLYCGYDVTAFTAESPLELIRELNGIDPSKLVITEW